MKNASQYIADFLNFLAEARTEHKFAQDKMSEQDKLTQDLLHSLELDGLDYRGRSKVATKLSTNRKERRYYKNKVEELEPLIVWLNDPANAKAINMLQQVLGAVRKQERYHSNRTYIPKAVKDRDK